MMTNFKRKQARLAKAHEVNSSMKERRKELQELLDFANLISSIETEELRNKKPGASSEEIRAAIKSALHPELILKKYDTSLYDLANGTDTSRWHKRPLNHLEVGMKGYVNREDIWKTLKASGLSINKAAKILDKGESFRKWAEKGGSPKEITRITRDELDLLGWAKVYMDFVEDWNLNHQESPLNSTAISLKTIQGFAHLFQEGYKNSLDKQYNETPEKFRGLLTQGDGL